MTSLCSSSIFSSMHEWSETLGLRVHKFHQYNPYTRCPKSVLTHQTCTGILVVSTDHQCSQAITTKRNIRWVALFITQYYETMFWFYLSNSCICESKLYHDNKQAFLSKLTLHWRLVFTIRVPVQWPPSIWGILTKLKYECFKPIMHRSKKYCYCKMTPF